MVKRVRSFNQRVAVSLTILFGSVGMFYLLFFYGLLPVFPVFSRYQADFLYWGNWVQLWALAVILCGTNLLSKSTEERSRAQQERIEMVLRNQSDTMSALRVVLDQLNASMGDMADDVDALAKEFGIEEGE